MGEGEEEKSKVKCMVNRSYCKNRSLGLNNGQKVILEAVNRKKKKINVVI